MAVFFRGREKSGDVQDARQFAGKSPSPAFYLWFLLLSVLFFD
jgi:hypothetical protein